MMLTHICPECKTAHEKSTTPEPDQLCPLCELAEKRIVDAVIPVKMWITNNVYVRETCCICKYTFKASMTLYELPIGYVCPDCAEELKIKTDVPAELIHKVQEKTFNLMLGE